MEGAMRTTPDTYKRMLRHGGVIAKLKDKNAVLSEKLDWAREEASKLADLAEARKRGTNEEIEECFRTRFENLLRALGVRK